MEFHLLLREKQILKVFPSYINFPGFLKELEELWVISNIVKTFKYKYSNIQN